MSVFRRNLSLILILGFAVGVLSFSFLTARAENSTINITLYEGDKVTSDYGFGSSADNITSPGPQLDFHVGDVVNMTVVNVGTMQHAWEITTEKSTSSQVLFNAAINPTTYLSPGQSGSVMFSVTQAGDFYYVCTYPGHIQLGMWGNVHVTGAIPEFPAGGLALGMIALFLTATAVYLARAKRTRPSL